MVIILIILITIIIRIIITMLLIVINIRNIQLNKNIPIRPPCG